MQIRFTKMQGAGNDFVVLDETAGPLGLSVEDAADGRVRFTVADTGVGFEPEQKARIFGRFHQADGSITRRFGGTGLGLTISRELAALHGGDLRLVETDGTGAAFELRLPG